MPPAAIPTRARCARRTSAASPCTVRRRAGDADTLVVLVGDDNLVKGASGQAVQNMNLMFGLPETTGLEQVAVVP